MFLFVLIYLPENRLKSAFSPPALLQWIPDDFILHFDKMVDGGKEGE